MKKQCKFHARKRDAKNMTNAPKWSQKGGRNREKVDKKRGPEIDAKKEAHAPWVGGMWGAPS